MPRTSPETLQAAHEILAFLRRGLGDLLFPEACVSCRAYLDAPAELPLCLACRARVERLLVQLCEQCGRFSAEGELCGDCRAGRTPTSFPVRAYARYAGPWKEVVLAAKPPRREDVARHLGALLAPLAVPFSPDVVIPVPLFEAKRRARGYSLPDRLAATCARRLKLPFRPEWLVRVRDTPSQVGRDPAWRAQNVAHAFASPSGLPLNGRRVLLIDDVVTTGATFAAAAEPLLAQGATLICLALARP